MRCLSMFLREIHQKLGGLVAIGEGSRSMNQRGIRILCVVGAKQRTLQALLPAAHVTHSSKFLKALARSFIQ